MPLDNVKRLAALPRSRRLQVMERLTPAELERLHAHLQEQQADRFRPYRDDPVGFIEDVLGESLWSKQVEIAESVRDNRRTAVPACHAPGKTHLAARIVAWWISSWPAGTAKVATTATRFRQVRNLLWPAIRTVGRRHNLPGERSMTEWKRAGDIVAYGFSSSKDDETAGQGLHAPHTLIVVDEAGGITHAEGQALEALMTGSHTRILVIGNPATDRENTWFEHICKQDHWNVIRISAGDTPAFTGEDAGPCQACPAVSPPHPVTNHLVGPQWVSEVVDDFGEESAFVTARVYAKFPELVTNTTIPFAWCEESTHNEDPREATAIRLGVDVAAEGGDEFVIARADGYRVRIIHRSSGQENASAVDVAGVVKRHVIEAESDRLATDPPIRVKVDSIGLGWGVVSNLEKWAEDGLIDAEPVRVDVRRTPREPDRFTNARAEMWWTGRELLEPDEDGQQALRLDVERSTLAQLSGPRYLSDGQGRRKIETKESMKKRGLSSPDRAEAILLALYEPPASSDVEGPGPMAVGSGSQGVVPS